jgi:hypothetical protein
MLTRICSCCCRVLREEFVRGYLELGLVGFHVVCPHDPHHELRAESTHTQEADPSEGINIPGIYRTVGTGTFYIEGDPSSDPPLPQPMGVPDQEFIIAWCSNRWVQVPSCACDEFGE